MRSIIALALLAASLTGCASMKADGDYTQNIHSWHGKKSALMVAALGQPQDIINTQSGYQLYIYKKDNFQAVAAPSSPSVGVNLSSTGSPILTSGASNAAAGGAYGGVALSCVVTFSVNPAGVIFREDKQGSGC